MWEMNLYFSLSSSYLNRCPAGLLTTINDLPADAVLIDSGRGDPEFLTWHQLMVFQHFADLLAKPLLVSVPSNITANELQALWEAGVAGIVVEAKQDKGRLNKLRQAINQLDSSPHRKRKKPAALLPHTYTGNGTETKTDEEE